MYYSEYYMVLKQYLVSFIICSRLYNLHLSGIFVAEIAESVVHIESPRTTKSQHEPQLRQTSVLAMICSQLLAPSQGSGISMSSWDRSFTTFTWELTFRACIQRQMLAVLLAPSCSMAFSSVQSVGDFKEKVSRSAITSAVAQYMYCSLQPVMYEWYFLSLLFLPKQMYQTMLDYKSGGQYLQLKGLIAGRWPHNRGTGLPGNWPFVIVHNRSLAHFF